MNTIYKYPKNKIFISFLVISLIGFLLRIIISQQGFMMDFIAHKVNVDIYKFNGNIFETGQYNYSPLVWINILYFLDFLPSFFSDDLIDFRWKVVLFLSLIDFVIFLILFRIHSLKVAILFYLNPISIFISGFHNQFDNVAILIGFLAVLSYEKFKKRYGFYFCAILLGISLCAKYILFLFPVWLAIKEKEWSKKILITVIPYLIFFLSFAPYLPENFEFIKTQIIFYKSFDNYPFWSIFSPQFLYNYIGARNLFFVTLFLTGLFLEKKDIRTSFYYYLIAIVLFSSGIANQYLAIPLIALAVFWNRFYLIYTITCTLFFMVDRYGLNINSLQDLIGWSSKKSPIGYKIIIFFLAIGYLENLITRKKLNFYIKKIFYWFVYKFRNQIFIKK